MEIGPYNLIVNLSVTSTGAVPPIVDRILPPDRGEGSTMSPPVSILYPLSTLSKRVIPTTFKLYLKLMIDGSGSRHVWCRYSAPVEF